MYKYLVRKSLWNNSTATLNFLAVGMHPKTFAIIVKCAWQLPVATRLSHSSNLLFGTLDSAHNRAITNNTEGSPRSINFDEVGRVSDLFRRGGEGL